MEPAPHSSENFPRNGPCPVGHYCPAGCLSPIPCPLGSIRNSTGTSVMFAHVMKRHFHAAGFEFKRDPLLIYYIYSLTVIYCAPIIGGVSMESCSSCPAGHYCSTDGLASPSGPCAAGFYCPFDFSSTTPYAFLCPKVRLNI